MANAWNAVTDDSKIYGGEIELPIHVHDKDVALQARETFKEHGFWDGHDEGFTDFLALILVERPDVLERLEEDYTAADARDARETISEWQDEDDPRDILDGVVDDIDYTSLSAEEARELKEQFTEAAESATEDEAPQPHEDILSGDDSDD
ncbi:hypothetical protein [Halomicrobium salinisoli]|uniref:hypothetical protein n=1 Tax=Halomicrobium salinisoli TaxID=2878391 RepID=UPI001CEFF080|nr:hypothetical protein [Halomicrobium salinisoli]